MDPERLQTQEEWKQFFKTKNVGYVVRSPEYPAEIERPLVEMEKSGYLVPYTEAEVRNLEGMRINSKAGDRAGCNTEVQALSWAASGRRAHAGGISKGARGARGVRRLPRVVKYARMHKFQ